MRLNILLCFLLASCAHVNTVYEYNPVANVYSKRVTTSPENIQTFDFANQGNDPLICFANLGAHGNGYAKKQDLVTALKKKTSELGGEAVLLLQEERSSRTSVNTYLGYGVSVTDQIATPSLYAQACNKAEVSLGIIFGKDWEVNYVKPNSLAEKNGIREKMVLIAINGTPIITNQYLIKTEILAKRKGDSVTIEFISNDGKKIKKTIVLE